MKEIIASIRRHMGFSEKKAKTYVALLKLGDATAQEIADKAGIQRTTVYNILPELQHEGLASVSLQGKKRKFRIEDPRLLRNTLDEKKQGLEQLLPQLQSLQGIFTFRPKITFYEGIGGMRALYQDTIDSVKPGDTILSFTGLSEFYELMPEETAHFFVDERVKKKVRIKIITASSKMASTWQKSAVKELREIKVLDKESFNFNADMEIYANKVAFISYKENFLGVIVESKEIHQMQKAAFELMWRGLGRER